jgi:transposase
MEDEAERHGSWELPDALWELMEPLLPVRNWWMGRPTEVDLHRVAAGIFYVLRTGVQWNACPREEFGSPSTVYYYFQQWRDAGVFEQLWAKAVEQYDNLQGIDWLWQSVDGTMTKAPQGGEKNRTQSHGPQQVGDQAERLDGGAGRAAGGDRGGSQRARHDLVGRDAGGSGRRTTGADAGGTAASLHGQGVRL